MKKTLVGILAVLLIAASAFAQLNSLKTRTDPVDYAGWALIQTTATTTAAGQVTGLQAHGTLSISPQANSCFFKANNGRIFQAVVPKAPLYFNDGANSETVTITSVSVSNGICTITISASNAHAAGTVITSGDYGLSQAIYDVHGAGGGVVAVGPNWGGTTANIAAALPYHNVSIVDDRLGPEQTWNVAPTAATFLAVPTALSANADCTVGGTTFCSDATVAGSASWGGAVYGCVSYVDVMGNEGPCSTTANFTSVASKAINITAPAASSGAVGYTIYLSLSGGSYAKAYKIPITSSVCTLTTIETVTAACAVANANYVQSGSNAQIAGYPVNTARIAAQVGAASSTTNYVPNSNGRTTYTYVPGRKNGLPGVVSASLPFTGASAPNTTVPTTLGVITFPAGFMNYVGKTIRVCGFFTEAANGSTATISTVQFYWDADGQNATGVPVLLGGPTVTATLVTANADQWSFCQNLKTTVSGAGVTAGSIQAGAGYLTTSYGAATTVAAATGPTIGAAAVGSLNLAGEARLQIVYLHTTGQDAATPILTDLTVEVVN